MSIKLPGKPNMRAVVPHLIAKDASRAIEFYKKAFGAEELYRSAGRAGKVMHSILRVGEGTILVADEFPEMNPKCTFKSPASLGGTSCCFAIQVNDADAAYKRATDAGATATMPVADAFWGDRYGQVTDPFGHVWEISSVKEELTPEQVEERARAFFSQKR
jgi:uncharacterized glyoxalase superfamily protein PhnB